MKALHWIYYAPYQKDIERVLQALRNNFFASKGYRDFMSELEKEHEERYDIKTIHDVTQRYVNVRNHSILGIRHISPYPHYFACLLFTDDELQFFLEAKRPTRKAIELMLAYDSLRTRAFSRLYHSQDEKTNLASRKLLSLEKTSAEDLVEILLQHEDIWLQLHQWACEYLEFRAWSTNVGKALPIPPEILQTKAPTRELIEHILKQSDVWELLRPMISYYTILYKDDLPDELVFIGGVTQPFTRLDLARTQSEESPKQTTPINAFPKRTLETLQPIENTDHTNDQLEAKFIKKETKFNIFIVEKNNQDFERFQAVLSRQPWDITLYQCDNFDMLFSIFYPDPQGTDIHFPPTTSSIIILDMRYIDGTEEVNLMTIKNNIFLQKIPVIAWVNSHSREYLSLPLLHGQNIHLFKAENLQQFLQLFLTRVWFGHRTTDTN
jgi:hypothetical protein